MSDEESTHPRLQQDGTTDELAQLVMHSPDGILVVDPAGAIRFVNRAASALLGRDANKMLGERFEMPLVNDASGESVVALTDDKQRSIELRFIGTIWSGAPARLIFLRDISDLKHEQAARTAAEARLARTQRIAGIGHWEWDVESQRLTCSDSIRQIFEFPRDRALTLESMVPIVHPEDRGKYQAFFERLLAGTERDELQFRLFLDDGRIKHVLQHAEVERDDDKTVHTIVGTMQDVSEIQQVRAALEEAQAIAHLGTWTYEPVAERASWSPEMFRIFGRPVAPVAPTREGVREMILQEDWPALDAALVRAVQEGVPYSVEFRIALPDGGSRWVSSRCAVHRDPTGRVRSLRGTLQDIDGRKRAEGLLHARLALLEFATSHSLSELLQKTLDEAGELTGSPIGFYHFVDSDQNYLTLQAWSTRTAREFCQAEGEGLHYRIDEAGVWTDAIKARRAVVHNDYASLPHKKGMPEGHAAVVRELVVPILRSDQVVAILGVGNKPRDYTDADVETVSFLADVAWTIAERKRAEEQLKHEQELNSIIFRAAQAIVVALRPDAKIMTINPYMEELCGYALRDVQGRDWFDTFVPERRRADARTLGSARANSDAPRHGGIEAILARNGRELLVEWYDKALTDEQGRVTGLLRVGHNVTDREESQRKLQASEERFRMVFENTTEGILVSETATRRCILGNKALCDLLGYTREELQQLTISDLHPPETVPEVEAALARQVVGVHRFADGVAVKRKDGMVLQADIGVTSMMYEGREVFIASFRDVTEVRRLRASVAQSDRLASMGMLAAGVAHEINNPLSYTLYNLESLSADVSRYAVQLARARGALANRLGESGLRELLGPDIDALDALALSDVQERFRDALEGSRRIKGITRGLGTFSRVERDEATPVDLRSPIESAINVAFNEIKYRARIVKDFNTGSPVLASEGRLAQVFLNLLINAAHAIPVGNVEQNKITITTWQRGNEVFAEVQDTGCGIPPENLARIFEPFFTTKPMGIGTGLGLGIAKSIITGYGGTIEARSEVGTGTRFLVRLPVAMSQGDGSEDVPSSCRALLGGRGRVLLVDDEPAVRGALRRILCQHEIVEAPSGAEARSLLTTDQNFDVVLCDMMMPNVSGMDLHRWLLREHPQLARKVVFVTGGAFTPGTREYLESVSNVRIDKPLDPTNLQKMVAEWVTLSKTRG